MAFPDDPLPVTVELFYDAVWNDITDFVYTRDPITITRGRANEASKVEAGRCQLTIDNRDGRFSPRNPTSPLYGKIGRNTPLRVSVDGDIRCSGEVPAWPQHWDQPGKDVWVPIEAAGVLRRLGQGASALQSAPRRAIAASGPVAYWPLTDGEDSTSAAPAVGSEPMRVRVTQPDWAAHEPTSWLEAFPTWNAPNVNGVMSGKVSMPAFSDQWVMAGLFMPNIPPGASTGIPNLVALTRSGTAEEHVGIWASEEDTLQIYHRLVEADGTVTFTDIGDFTATGLHDGRPHWVELRAWQSGSDMRVAAHMDGEPLSLSSGSTTLASTTLLTPIYVDAAAGTDDSIGHIALWDNHAAADGLAPAVLGYAGETAGVRIERLCAEEGVPFTIQPDEAEGLRLSGGYASTPDHADLDVTGDLDLRIYLRPDDWTPVVRTSLISKWEQVTSNDQSYTFTLETDGTLRLWWTTDGADATQADAQSSETVLNIAAETGPDLAVRVTADVDNGGGDADITFYTAPDMNGPWTQLGDVQNPGTTISFFAGTAPLTIGAEDIVGAVIPDDVLRGTVYAAQVRNGIDGTIAASPDFTTQDVGATSFADTTGKTWTLNGAARIARLDDAAALGPQRIDTFLDLIFEAADTDLGILSEPRAALGLAYRVRTDLYKQAPALELPYAGVFGSLPEPVDDDQLIRNDITVKRPGGSSARAVLESGSLSVQPPPDGIGTYDTSDEANVVGDGFLANQAHWRLNLGTVDEARYPRLHLALTAPAFTSDAPLTADAAALDVGDRLTISDPPDWLPPDLISQLAQGFTETLGNNTWDVEVNASPESPYQVAGYEAAQAGTHRYDTAGSSLAIGFDAGADTSMIVEVDVPPLWTTDVNEFPFDIECGGVRLTVTDISGTTSTQAFVIVQTPVNGVVKTIPAGTPVSLWTKASYAL